MAKNSEVSNIVYGKDLFFERSKYKDYVAEAKRRLESYNIIFKNAEEENFDVKAIKSIICWETGWLSDEKARKRVVEYNNVLGIEISGQPRKFENVNDCIDYFVYDMILSMTRYRKASILRQNGELFIQELFNAGYCPDPSWKDGVLNIYYNW
jgi:hypothetical protein